MSSGLGRIEARLLTAPINNADATWARAGWLTGRFARAQLTAVEAMDLWASICPCGGLAFPCSCSFPCWDLPFLAQPEAAVDPPGHHHHGHPGGPVTAPSHSHSLGPAGATYDLRWLDALQQHHTGALRMSERVFNGASPGVGALARQIWRDQAQEIRAMILWRRAWYPQAPIYPVVLRPGGDPDSLADLTRMDAAKRDALRMAVRWQWPMRPSAAATTTPSAGWPARS